MSLTVVTHPDPHPGVGYVPNGMLQPPGGFWTEDGYARITDAGAIFYAFCERYVTQTKGRWANTTVLLEPWELLMASEMLRAEPASWIELPPDALFTADKLDRYLKEWVSDTEFPAGNRVYTEAYVQISKKNGKSMLAVCVALYLLCGDGEQGAEVYSAATSKEQADYVFRQAKAAVEKSPLLQDFVRTFSDRLYVPSTESVYRELSWDPGGHEGIGPSGYVIDELHRHVSRDLYDVLTSGTEAREQPFGFVITNAGTETDSICGEKYSEAKAVLERKPEAREDLFAFVPEIPEDEASDESRWKEVNPASWVTLERLKRNRKKFPWAVFKRRFLNMWTSSEDTWVLDEEWSALEDLEVGFEFGDPIVVGVDLGLSHDTAAIVWGKIVEPGERMPIRAMIWGVKPKGSPGSEDAWVPAHEIVDGRFDADLAARFIEQLAEDYEIVEIGYDPWRFHTQAASLERAGLPLTDFPQTDSRMVPGTELLYEEIIDGRLAHDGDEVLAAHVRNCAAEETRRGWRLSKRKASRPMDGGVATLIVVTLGRDPMNAVKPRATVY